MRTSNILLLSLFLLTLVVPFCLIMLLKNKIGTSDFTNVDFAASHVRAIVHKPLPACTALKIKSMYPLALKCHLIPSDSSYYAYPQYEEDGRLHIERAGDTVSVIYGFSSAEDRDAANQERDNFSIDLHIASWQGLEIDGATVLIDSSWNDHSSRNVVLSNNGQISLGDGYKGNLEIIHNNGNTAPRPGHGQD